VLFPAGGHLLGEPVVLEIEAPSRLVDDQQALPSPLLPGSGGLGSKDQTPPPGTRGPQQAPPREEIDGGSGGLDVDSVAVGKSPLSGQFVRPDACSDLALDAVGQLRGDRPPFDVLSHGMNAATKGRSVQHEVIHLLDH